MKIIKAKYGQQILVDDEDFDKLSKDKWYISGDGYAVTSLTATHKAFMHRDLIPTQTNNSMVVHHKDGNKLNNQKDNICVVSKSTNVHKTLLPTRSASGYYGVFPSQGGKFIARLKAEGHRYYLGTFACAKQAALAINKKAKELFGEHARLNQVD